MQIWFKHVKFCVLSIFTYELIYSASIYLPAVRNIKYVLFTYEINKAIIWRKNYIMRRQPDKQF